MSVTETDTVTVSTNGNHHIDSVVKNELHDASILSTHTQSTLVDTSNDALEDVLIAKPVEPVSEVCFYKLLFE